MMAEINVTPFVDVMLVLLVIFMVTAPLMTTGVELDLPRAEAPPMNAEPNQLVVSMAADETYTLSGMGMDEGLRLTLPELQTRLAAFGESNGDVPVFVRADGQLPYEKVLQLLAIAKDSGIPKVGLVTQPGPPTEGR
jgi:biopolymer transport protein TolR